MVVVLETIFVMSQLAQMDRRPAEVVRANISLQLGKWEEWTVLFASKNMRATRRPWGGFVLVTEIGT